MVQIYFAQPAPKGCFFAQLGFCELVRVFLVKPKVARGFFIEALRCQVLHVSFARRHHSESLSLSVFTVLGHSVLLSQYRASKASCRSCSRLMCPGTSRLRSNSTKCANAACSNCIFLVKDDMPPKPVQAVTDRTALDELMAKGRTHKRQERWVVLGGLC